MGIMENEMETTIVIMLGSYWDTGKIYSVNHRTTFIRSAQQKLGPCFFAFTVNSASCAGLLLFPKP